MLPDERRDVRPWRRGCPYAALGNGARFVSQSPFQKANERDAVTPRVVDRPSLKPVSREEDSFVGTGSPLLISKHLYVLALDRTSMILALHQDYKLDAQLTKP